MNSTQHLRRCIATRIIGATLIILGLSVVGFLSTDSSYGKSNGRFRCHHSRRQCDHYQ